MLYLSCPFFLTNNALAQIDFSNGGGGSASFELNVAQDEVAFLGELICGLEGLRIETTSSSDVDIQLDSGSIRIVNAEDVEGGIKDSGGEATCIFNDDSITYSGFFPGSSFSGGDEFVQFNDPTSNTYMLSIFGFEAGLVNVDITWTGQTQEGCSGVPFCCTDNFDECYPPVEDSPTPNFCNESIDNCELFCAGLFFEVDGDATCVPRYEDCETTEDCCGGMSCVNNGNDFYNFCAVLQEDDGIPIDPLQMIPIN